jgi:hypothetical protein
VNLVVAGILTAVIAGAATMAVKYGMRGSRYGWEEAATDAGMTAIEAATAGIGAGLGKGAAAGAKASGILGRTGAALTKTFGKMGGAVAREAIVGAIGGAARTAIQDETWRDGIGGGLRKVGMSGVKGAAASAVNTLVSQSVSGKLTGAMEKGMLQGAKAGPMGQLGNLLGPAGREMTASVVSQTLGSMAATATDIVIDVGTGHYQGSLKDALLAIGESGLKEMFTSAMRTGAEMNNKARYRALLKAARESGQPLSDQDRRTLRLAAISAGEDHYGLSPEEAQAKAAAKAAGDAEYDPKKARYEREVYGGREALAGLPKEMQARLAGLDVGTLGKMRELMGHPTMGSPQDRLQLLHMLGHAHQDVNAEGLMKDLQQGRRSLEAHAEEAAASRKQVQRALGEGLEGPARKYLKDVPTEGLDKLGKADLEKVSAMIKSGQMDEAVAAQLLAAAKKASPELNAEQFQANLKRAVESVAMGREMERAGRAKARADVLAAVSEEGRAAFADLPDDAISKVKKLLTTDGKASDQLKDQLYRAAAAENPGLKKADFDHHLDAAVKHASEQRSEARKVKQAAREERLGEYPPKVRGALAQLPEEALFQLRMAQARGEEISPQLRQSLHDAAKRESPGVDMKKLNAAMDEAVKRPSEALKGAEGARLRKELESGVPEDLRQKLSKVPILVMKGADFDAFTGGETGQAVTLLVNGKPTVVLREGASPKVLREEGIHALQAQEPRWRDTIGALDEAKLGKWAQLPLEEQLALYKSKVAVEIDAHQRMVAGLEHDVEGAKGVRRDELKLQLEQARAALTNLGNRMAEVESLSPMKKRAIELGLASKQQELPFLDQPARLFSKEKPPALTTGEVQTALAARKDIVFEVQTKRPDATLDPKFDLKRLLEATGGKPVRLVMVDVEGQEHAKLQVLHPDEPDPKNPTLKPPYLLAHDGKRFVLIENPGNAYPPLKAHQDAYYVVGDDKTKPTLRQWGVPEADTTWRLVKSGAGFEVGYELPDLAGRTAALAAGPKEEPKLKAPAPHTAIKDLKPVPVEPAAEGKTPKVVELADLAKVLMSTKPGSLSKEHLESLLQLATHYQLISGDRKFVPGTAEPGKPGARTFFEEHNNAFFQSAVRQHVVHLLATMPEYADSPHALVHTVSKAKAMAEQHAHLDASLTAEYLMLVGNKPLEGLALELTKGSMREVLQRLDLLAPDAFAAHGGAEMAPGLKSSVEKRALEFVKAFEAYQRSGSTPMRLDVQEALRGFLESLAVYRPVDVTLHEAAMQKPPTRPSASQERFFAAFGALQEVIRSSVGNVDAALAHQIQRGRLSAPSLAAEEVRFGLRGKDSAKELVRQLEKGEVVFSDAERAFILSIAKNPGSMNLRGENMDAADLRGLILERFAKGEGTALRKLVGLDSSGVEGHRPVVSAQEYAQVTVLNLRESLKRLAGAGDDWHEGLAAILTSAGKKDLAEWVLGHKGLTADQVMAKVQDDHAKAQAKFLEAAKADELKPPEQRTGKERLLGGEPESKGPGRLEGLLDAKMGAPGKRPGATEEPLGLNVEQLALLNRMVVDTLRKQGKMGSDEPRAGEAKPEERVKQLGLTVHAGEQILSRSALSLLDDVTDALRMGADRIGHAVILGMTGEQIRALAPGRLRKRDVELFNKRREELLQRVIAAGVVVELNITSNLVISNLTIDLHTAAVLSKAGVRMSVNTDDEMLLHTNVAEEMHRFAQIKGVGTVEVALAGLEAFASRLGTWELTQAASLQATWKKALTDIVPETVRNKAIDAVIERFLGAEALKAARAAEAAQATKPADGTQSGKPGETARPQTPMQKALEEALRYVFH